MDKRIINIKKFFRNIISGMIPSKNLRRKVRQYLDPVNDKRVTKYFENEYVWKIKPEEFIITRKANLPTDTEYIWQCWLQGVEQSPAIVKNCMKSVEKYKNANQQIIIVTEENYNEYIDLPPFIINKRKSGKIPAALFSDILRVYLLASYGGYWIDATCLLTAKIPQTIADSNFFMFHSAGEFEYTQIQSCFIHSKENEYLLQRWKQLMTELCKKEDFMLHYFQMHLMFKAMIRCDKKAKEQYEKMPYIQDNAMHIIFDFCKNNIPYSPDKLKLAESKSFIHKLTYKFKQSEGSFIEALEKEES